MTQKKISLRIYILLFVGIFLPSFYAQKPDKEGDSLSLDSIKAQIQFAKKNYDTNILFTQKKQLENKYLSVSKDINEIHDEKILAKLGFIYRAEGLFLKKYGAYIRSMDAFKMAINLYEKLQDSTQIAENYYKLAGLYEDNMQQNEAIDCYKKAIRHGKYYRSDYYKDLGECYTNMGEYEQALACNDSALKYSQEKKMAERLAQHNDIYLKRGNAYAEYEKWDSCFLYRKKVLDYAIKIQDKEGLYDAHLNFANFYKDQKKHDLALFHYEKALFFAKKTKKKEDIWLSFNNLTVVYTERKEFDKAFEMADSALQVAHLFYGKKHPNIGITLQNIGEIHDSLKRWGTAISYYKEAIFHSIDSTATMSDTLSAYNMQKCADKVSLLSQLKDLADAYQALHIMPAAFKYYQKCDALIDMMRAEHQSQDTKLFWREKSRSLYENAIHIAFALGKKDSVFYFMEKSRAILLLEELQKNLAKNEDKQLAASPIASIDAIQENFCQNDRTFISYFVASKKIYVANIQAHHYEVDTLPKGSGLAHQIDTLSAMISDNGKAQEWEKYDDFYKKEAQIFYQQYIAPLKLSPNNELILSLDADLWKIPVEALWNGENYLVEKYAISYAYSGSVLLQTAQNKPIAKYKSWVVFAPIHFKNAPSLLETQHTIEQLQQKGKVKMTVFKEERANYTTFIQHASEYNYLWLATHASAGEKPYIMLRDSNLSLSAIYQQHFQAEMIILSACESSTGTWKQGEGIMSLARGFAYSGVPVTMAAKWKVAEGKTMEMVADFLTQKAGTEAFKMQQAKKALIGNPPYYWSGMVMMGCKAEKVSFFYWKIWILAFILLGGSYFLYRKYRRG